MNKFVDQHMHIYELTMVMRDQMMDILSDEDLAFSPGGENLTLGALCVRQGQYQRCYIESLATLKMDWSYKHPDPSIAGSVSRLKAWFTELDEELKAKMRAMSDADLDQIIDRGFELPVGAQLHVYREGLFIFYGKASIYLKAMGKERPEQWQTWIG
jgi:hypothetical protein